MELPSWAESLFLWKDNTFDVVIPEDMSSVRLTKIKNDFRNEYKKITDWSKMSVEEINQCAQNYMLCNIGLGWIALAKANEQKISGINSNDGRNRQHWIPKCYLKAFSENGLVTKVPTGVFTEGFKARQAGVIPPPRMSEKINLYHSDFCESPSEQGQFYPPEFELTVSKIEGDYAEVTKSARIIGDLWDFLVLSTFFFVFHIRTNVQYQNSYPFWDYKMSMLIDLIPRTIGHYDIHTYHASYVLQHEENGADWKQTRFPFTDHPLIAEVQDLEAQIGSLWAIHSPECFLWIRHKELGYGPEHISSYLLTEKLMSIIGDNSHFPLYFRPSDPIWRLNLSDVRPVLGKDGKQLTVPFPRL